MRFLADVSRRNTPGSKTTQKKKAENPKRPNPARAGDVARPLFEEGLELHRKGALARAEKAYRKILAAHPRHAGALHLLGVLLAQRKSYESALALIERAIAIEPGNADAHNNRANVLRDLGRLEAALAGYGRAIRLRRDFAEAHCNRAAVLLALKRPAAARAGFERAARIKPESAEAHAGLGNALLALERPEEALAGYDHAVRLRPDYAEAHQGRAQACAMLGRLDEALAGYDRAIAARPDFAEAYYNRANVLKELARTEAALVSFDRAIALRPDYAEAFYNRGNVLLDLKRPGDALASFDAALSLRPEDVARRQNLALCRLLVGDFARGWETYERRWQRGQAEVQLRTFRKPLWLGEEALEGKTILLHSEQGIGDTLQFCRYAALVRDRGARVILEAPAALAGLLGRLDGVAELVEKGRPIPPFDTHCPLMSLPLAFKTDLATIPAPGRYITADPDLAAAWHERLGPKARPRVGLAWSGNPRHAMDRRRSIPLATMRALLAPDIEWFSLHREVREGDAPLLAASPDIRHFGDKMDFDSTAALIETLDLVISVDTSIAHLAGAIGKPLWVLLPHVADWRWLTEREDSPWYPSARLIRQLERGDWPGVMQRVYLELRTWLREESGDGEGRGKG
jgi:tetratricopeptide (TPR) repeat protein